MAKKDNEQVPRRNGEVATRDEHGVNRPIETNDAQFFIRFGFLLRRLLRRLARRALFLGVHAEILNEQVEGFVRLCQAQRPLAILRRTLHNLIEEPSFVLPHVQDAAVRLDQVPVERVERQRLLA